MKKRTLAWLLALMLLLTGCSHGEAAPGKQYKASFLTLFDTVTYISGIAPSEEAFQTTAQSIHDELLVYHQLFDIYHDYDGIHNLKTVNDNAGIAPVKVDRKVIDLLLDCREYYDLTGGRVNVGAGTLYALLSRFEAEHLIIHTHTSENRKKCSRFFWDIFWKHLLARWLRTVVA